MEFSIASIREAHKLYTGPDFPKLINVFKSMGMVTNIFNLETGVVTYMNRVGDRLEDVGIQVDFCIGESATYESALLALQRNQKGESDFYTFCNEIAKAGIYKWLINLEKMTCGYYDKSESLIILENIPT